MKGIYALGDVCGKVNESIDDVLLKLKIHSMAAASRFMEMLHNPSF